jgi:hypothetical protein
VRIGFCFPAYQTDQEDPARPGRPGVTKNTGKKKSWCDDLVASIGIFLHVKNGFQKKNIERLLTQPNEKAQVISSQ